MMSYHVRGGGRAILARLASGQATDGELAQPFAISPPAVTKHLKVLQRAGPISQDLERQWRPCRLQPQPLEDAAHWVGDHRQLREHRLDRLEDYLRELQTKERRPWPTPPECRWTHLPRS